MAATEILIIFKSTFSRQHFIVVAYSHSFFKISRCNTFTVEIQILFKMRFNKSSNAVKVTHVHNAFIITNKERIKYKANKSRQKWNNRQIDQNLSVKCVPLIEIWFVDNMLPGHISQNDGGICWKL